MWTPYCHCSVTCGGGEEIRTRLCDNPAPQYGGDECVGRANETRLCADYDCPGKSLISIEITNNISNNIL